jgi:excinuclease ABC subunit C
MIGEQFFRERKREIAPEDAAEAPNAPAVFVLWADQGAPYLARTALLRRRLTRLLRESGAPSRMLNLRGLIRRIEYWQCGSQLESSLLFYTLARTHFPSDYLKITKLRMPAYVKLTLANRFPRTLVTTRFGGGRGMFFGPFRSRASAEQFEKEALDLFQIRRCQENLEPRADHPGCMYGEMGRCLRPCQTIVNEAEYASEVARFGQFLSTKGTSLLETVEASRDRFSEELQFENAERQHKLYERIQEVLSLRDDLATASDQICGVAITSSASAETVTLWFMLHGAWADPADFSVAQTGDQAVSLDNRLRHQIAELSSRQPLTTDRQEHLALLAKWFYSSWRDGEWIAFNNLQSVPYRKLVNAIARVAKNSGTVPNSKV